MDPRQIKDKWIAALRSGKYRQAIGRLKTINNSRHSNHCCLGVLCEVIQKETGKGKWSRSRGTDESSTRFFEFDGYREGVSLPYAIEDALNLEEDWLTELMYMNDDGIPFAEIANKIEEEWKV